MAHRDGITLHPWQGTEYGNTCVFFHRLPDNCFMAQSGYMVEYHSINMKFRIKPLTAQDKGCGCPCHLGAVQNQDNRGIYPLGKFCRAT